MDRLLNFTENKIINLSNIPKYRRISNIYRMIWDNYELNSYNTLNLIRNDTYHIFMKIRHNNHTMEINSNNSEALVYSAGLLSVFKDENELLLLKKAYENNDQEGKYQLSICLINKKYPPISIKYFGENYQQIGYTYLEELCLENYKFATSYIFNNHNNKNHNLLKIIFKTTLQYNEYLCLVNIIITNNPRFLFHNTYYKVLYDIHKKFKLKIHEEYINSFNNLHKNHIQTISNNCKLPNEISNVIYNFV
jgi:hypothetical protein